MSPEQEHKLDTLLSGLAVMQSKQESFEEEFSTYKIKTDEHEAWLNKGLGAGWAALGLLGTMLILAWEGIKHGVEHLLHLS